MSQSGDRKARGCRCCKSGSAPPGLEPAKSASPAPHKGFQPPQGPTHSEEGKAKVSIQSRQPGISHLPRGLSLGATDPTPSGLDVDDIPGFARFKSALRPGRLPGSMSSTAHRDGAHWDMERREHSVGRELHEASTKAQAIAAIERTLVDMDALVAALDRYVAEEEVRTRIRDVHHCAYSTAARAAHMRSNNLKKSYVRLQAMLHDLTADYKDALPAPDLTPALGPSGTRSTDTLPAKRPSHSVNVWISPG